MSSAESKRRWLLEKNKKPNTPPGAVLVKTELFRGTVEPDVKQSGKAVILLPGLAVEEMMS